MPNVIMALRSSPLALFLAMLAFVCTLLIAANSIGKINAGGDDEGSGLGGTGKSSEYGLGGTGGPRPFIGDAQTDGSAESEPGNELDNQAPWVVEEPMPQDGPFIPAEMQPLVELHRNRMQEPNHSISAADDPDRLYILDDEATGLSAPARRLLDMANSDEDLIAPTVLELRLRVPEGPIDTGKIETYRMELAAEPTPTELQDEEDEVAEHDATDERTSPERLQRPELPPFQRMRPALDRASMAPPRVQPLNM